MGILPILSLFIFALATPGDCLEEVSLGRVCARTNCCAEDTVCATKVSCPYWQVIWKLLSVCFSGWEIGFGMPGLKGKYVHSYLWLDRKKKRRTQKVLPDMMTYLKDREPRSAMPPERLCAVQWRRGTRPPSHRRASAASTRTRSLSLAARTPRWAIGHQHVITQSLSLISARRVSLQCSAWSHNRNKI